jgi:cysteine desulfurase/selenocysteine lyase
MDVSRIREDFPVLQQKVKGKPVVYMDSACMSLKPKQVVEASNDYYTKFTACGGRSVHSFGKTVSEKVQEAREDVAKFLGAKKAQEIVFTKNTTESINLVAHSIRLGNGDIVLTTDREHNSNLLPWQQLAAKGVKHDIVKSKEDGTFDLEGFEQQICDEVKLVSFVHSSNLDGYTLPAKEMIKIAHSYGAKVLVDGAQSAPHKDIDVRKLDADFFACSGHKMLGPTGVGMLYGKANLLEQLQPYIVGGNTVESTTFHTCTFLKPPERFEAGLQNYAGIIGMKAAVDYLRKVGLDNIARHETDLSRKLAEGVKEIKNLEIAGVQDYSLRGGVFPFNIKGLGHHEIAMMLGETGNIMVRSGQHCCHSWFADRGMLGSVRASLYLYNTKEEVDFFLEKLSDIAKLGKK